MLAVLDWLVSHVARVGGVLLGLGLGLGLSVLRVRRHSGLHGGGLARARPLDMASNIVLDKVVWGCVGVAGGRAIKVEVLEGGEAERVRV